FALAAGHALAPDAVPAAAVIHAWTAGAVGVMTLAVMTRASLGHTGHALTAGPATTAIYLSILTAALLRIVAPFTPEWHHALLNASGVAWTLAFTLFALAYGPILVVARKAKAS
ncbi:MAG: NnrS family protein, partial [Xanthobacteraceae bacterium]